MHGAKEKRCSSEGCTNYSQKGGVCKRHGAKVKRKFCSSERCTNIVVKRGAEEECASSMVQSSKCAAVRDALIRLIKVECAEDMEQRSNDAAVKDARIMLIQEECALSMGQRGRDATAKGALTKSSVVEYVGGTGHIAILKINLLHLDQNST
eukprot:scaffold6595_cov92-Skeletonema_marinoi.AAC.1